MELQGISPVILFSHTFLAFLRTLSFQQSKIFSHQLYELCMISLCQVIAAWNHHGSALQGMRLPEKYQINHLQPLFPIYHLLGLVNRSLHRFPFPQGRSLYVSICQRWIIPDHRFHIAPPTVSWFAHEHLHEMYCP